MPYGSQPPKDKKKKVKIPNKERKRPPVKKGKLTDKQEKALAKHRKHHTLAHINKMTSLMKQGATFASAHKRAMSEVGK